MIRIPLLDKDIEEVEFMADIRCKLWADFEYTYARMKSYPVDSLERKAIAKEHDELIRILFESGQHTAIIGDLPSE